MGSTGVGLALLLCFAGPLDAQTGADSCHRPELRKGYFVPEAESYDPGALIGYTCDEGHKPAAEGWWATSWCQNGTWVPKPQCIDEGACLPPEIPNAVFPARAPAWYPNGHKVRITCDKGFEHLNFEAMAECKKGSWSTVPVCTKHVGACGEPPRVLHAVVIKQGYQELFPEDALVQYECKDGYEMEGGTEDKKSIYCIGGTWTEAPTCIGSCVLDPANRPRNDIKLSKVEYVKEGAERTFPCIWDWDPHTVIARCTAGKVTLSNCCRPNDRERS